MSARVSGGAARGARRGARVGVVSVGALALVLGAACGKKVPNGQIAAADRGRAQSGPGAAFDDRSRCEYRGREDRETSETAGPGALLPNVRRVYQVVGQGDERRKVMVCREIDTNLDGVKDVVRTFNDKGESLREEADSNYDGRIDTWITFSSGRMSQVALDLDHDGRPEEWKYYVGGQLSRIQRDTNRDTKPDVWEFYVRGQLERMGVDVDQDGHVDRWDHDEVTRRTQDLAERAAEASAGAARATSSASPAGSSPPPADAPARPGTPPASSARTKLEPTGLATALRLAGALAPVGVFEANDVIELGGRDLENVNVAEGHHAVHGAGGAMKGLAGAEFEHAQAGPLADLELHAAALHEEGLVFLAVVLARELLALGDVQELADVSLGMGPDELVAPRLVDAAHGGLG